VIKQKKKNENTISVQIRALVGFGSSGGDRRTGRRQCDYGLYEGVSAHRTGGIAHVIGKVVSEHVNESTVAGGHMHRGPAVPAFGHELKANLVERAKVGVPRPYLVLGGPSEVHPATGVGAEHGDLVRFMSHLDYGRLGRIQRTPVNVLEVDGEHLATGNERGVHPRLSVRQLQLHHEQYVPRRRFESRRLMREVHGPLCARVRVHHQHSAPSRVRHESVMVAISGSRAVRRNVLQARRGLGTVVRGTGLYRLDFERLVRRLRRVMSTREENDYTLTNALPYAAR
jgi:hypothetical protein